MEEISIYERVSSLIVEIQNGGDEKYEELFFIINPGFIYIFKEKGIDERYYEDLLQECDLAVSNGISTLKNTRAGIAWVNRIASNKAVDFIRGKKAIDNSIVFQSDIYEGVPDDKVEVPEDIFINNESRKQLRDIIFSLDQRQQNVILNMYFYGKTINQISEEQNINPNTVKTIHSRAKKELKEKILLFERKSSCRLHSVLIAPLLYIILRDEGIEVIKKLNLTIVPCLIGTNEVIASGVTRTAKRSISRGLKGFVSQSIGNGAKGTTKGIMFKSAAIKGATAVLVAGTVIGGVVATKRALERRQGEENKLSQENSEDMVFFLSEQCETERQNGTNTIESEEDSDVFVYVKSGILDGDNYLLSCDVFKCVVVAKQRWDETNIGDKILINCYSEIREFIKTGELSAEGLFESEYYTSYSLEEEEGYYYVYGENDVGIYPYTEIKSINQIFPVNKNMIAYGPVDWMPDYSIEEYLEQEYRAALKLTFDSSGEEIIGIEQLYSQ